MLEDHTMDKKNRSGQTLNKGNSSEKKSLDASSNKQIPKQSRRREPAGAVSKNEASGRSKPMPQKYKSLDKRPKPRSSFGGGKEGPKINLYEDEPELGSIYTPGSKKQNLNHLLNFQYASPAGQYGSNRGRSSYTGRSTDYSMGYNNYLMQSLANVHKHKYNKEQFLQANCQFVVRAGEDYNIHLADPDILVKWDFIQQIRGFGNENIKCPICLDIPRAAQITRCGHCFCWPCILHYLALSDKSWRKCPICYESVHCGDLKSFQAVVKTPRAVNQEVTFQLMKRERGSTLVSSVRQWEFQPADTLMSVGETQLDTTYAKLLAANVKDILDIINTEQVELTVLLEELKREQCPTLCFTERALELLQKRRSDVLNKEEDKSAGTEDANASQPALGVSCRATGNSPYTGDKTATTPETIDETPVVKTETPVVKIEAPVVNTETPVVKIETPVVKIETLVVKIETPVVKIETPVVKTETPVVKIETPVVKIETPVVKTETPVVKTLETVPGVNVAMVKNVDAMEEKDQVPGVVGECADVVDSVQGSWEVDGARCLADGLDLVGEFLPEPVGSYDFKRSRVRYESVSSEEPGYHGPTSIQAEDLDIGPPPHSTTQPSRYFYFYQAQDGQQLFLHAVNVRMLEMSYGTLAACPPLLTGRILEKETGSMTPELRTRLRYLQHLPVTCQFEVAEIELKPPLVTQATVDRFKDQLASRERRRLKRAREDRRRAARIDETLGAQLRGSVAPVAGGKHSAGRRGLHIESRLQFPECGVAGIPGVSSALASYSSESSRASSPRRPESPLTAAVIALSLEEQNINQSTSFAQRLRAGSSLSAGDNAVFWPSVGERERKRTVSSEEAECGAPRHSLAQIMGATSQPQNEASTAQSGAAQSSKKKKRKQQTLLFATGGMVVNK